MQIDNNLILYLEDLSNLTLSESEKSNLIADLQKILNSFSCLSAFNTDGVPECIQPWDSSASSNNVNILRNDEVTPSLDPVLILKNAPVKNEEFFIAPKTVE